MNQQFAQYVTSTAFNLTMGRHAINELFGLCHFCEPNGTPLNGRSEHRQYGLPVEGPVRYYLERRGLIEPSAIPTCECNRVPTKAGLLVAELLREAGFTDRYEKKIPDSE